MYPLQFVDTNSDIIKVSPENNRRLALSGTDMSFVINLKFDFFKKNFKYTFFGLLTFYNKLGGSGSAAGGMLS
jgi:hypothetical protein